MNPFKPTAGKMPPVLIGRESIVRDFSEALENGAGAPGRLMLITGQRGFGKTVMLTELSKLARNQGWFVISETASTGLCSRLIAELSENKDRNTYAEFNPALSISGVASLQLGSVGFSKSQPKNIQGKENIALALHEAIEERLKKVGKGKGVLFAIDEAQAASREDMVALATTVQHIIRNEDMKDVPDNEKKGIAFIFAGLPSMVDELVNDNVLTFLRRSQRQDLKPVHLREVAYAYVQAVSDSGLMISFDNALQAAKFAQGYPYMVQLIGYYMWQSAWRRGSKEIEAFDIEQGVADSKVAFGEAVCAPAYKGLTDAQQEFVRAMAIDEGISKVADIAKRVGKSISWANKYRASLITAKIIAPAGRGSVSFEIPYFGEYLQRTFLSDDISQIRCTDPETVEYAFMDELNQEQEFTTVEVRDEQQSVALLQELIDAGYEGDELLQKFKEGLKKQQKLCS